VVVVVLVLAALVVAIEVVAARLVVSTGSMVDERMGAGPGFCGGCGDGSVLSRSGKQVSGSPGSLGFGNSGFETGSGSHQSHRTSGEVV